MAIYNIFDFYEKEVNESLFSSSGPKINPDAFTTNKIDENFLSGTQSFKDRAFSSIAARFFFFVLFLADIIWGVYSFVYLLFKFSLCLATLFKIPLLKKSALKSYLNVKRSLVCGISLIVAIFSPALGIMFSCMYFLMYDKSGIDEIVPSSLKDQFKSLFPV